MDSETQVVRKLSRLILHNPRFFSRSSGDGNPAFNRALFIKALRSNRLLSRRSVEARGLLNWPVVEETVALHMSKREDHSDHLMALLNLEIWRASTSTGASLRTWPRN